MATKTLCAAMLFLIVAVFTARADALEVIGTGNLSCGKWMAARESKNQVQITLTVQWVAGFLVSFSYYSGSASMRTPDLEAMAFFLDKFCRDRPLDPILFAAAELVQQSGGPPALHNQQQRGKAGK